MHLRYSTKLLMYNKCCNSIIKNKQNLKLKPIQNQKRMRFTLQKNQFHPFKKEC